MPLAPTDPRLQVLPPSFLLGNDFHQFAAEFAGNVEVIRWSFYSFVAYPAAGATQLLMTAQSIGTAANGIFDTNFQVPGQLAGSEAMIIRNVRVVPLPAAADQFVVSGPAVALSQWYDVMTRLCMLQFQIGDKIYIQGAPLTLFPAGMGLFPLALQGTATLGTGIQMVQNGHPSNMALWEEDPPIYVPPTRTINVNLNWSVARAVTTAGRIGVLLDGWRVRLVQ